MAVDGLLADEELLSDLLAGEAFGDQLHHLELARTKRVLRRGLTATRAVEIVAHQRPHGRRIEERLATHGGPAGLDQIAVGRGLEHVAGCPGLERLEEVLLVVVHREDQDAQLWLALRQFERCLETGHPRHRHVQNREMHIFGERKLDSLRAIAGFGDHLQVRRRVEHHAEAVADDLMVVGEQDPCLERNGH